MGDEMDDQCYVKGLQQWVQIKSKELKSICFTTKLNMNTSRPTFFSFSFDTNDPIIKILKPKILILI